MSRRKNIILTGELHSGKSTLVREVLRKLRCEMHGLFCEPLDDGQKRLGFGMRKMGQTDLDVFAHIDFPENRFGHYGFAPEAFERAADYILACLAGPPSLFVLDEIGFFERNVRRYQTALGQLLDAPVPTLLVLQQRAAYFWAKIKERRDVIVLTLHENNHATLQQELYRRLKEVTNPDRGVD